MAGKRIIWHLAISSLICLLMTSPVIAAATHYNWPEKNKTTWKITTLGSSKVKLAARFENAEKYGVGTKNIPETSTGYRIRGGAVTESYYAFALYKNDQSASSIYLANRSSGKVTNIVSKKLQKTNNVYYTWGAKHLRIESNDNKDGCYDLEAFKTIDTSKCKTKRADVYGAKGLTNEGQAQANGYVYNAGWDSGDGNYGQKWYHERNSNAVFIYKQGSKELVKTLYIPKSVVDGELKDISIDGNGDLYLFFDQTSTNKGASFYKVSKKDVGTTKDQTSTGGGSSSGGSSSGGGGSGGGGSSSGGGGSGGGGSSSGGSSSGGSSSTSGGGSSGGSSSGGGSGSSDSGDDSKVQLTPQREQQCAVILAVFCSDVEADGEKAILNLLAFAAGLFTMGFGMLATIGLIHSGYLYMTARENENQIIAAKQRIRDIVLGLFLWILVVACIGLLLPGTNAMVNEVIQGVIMHYL
ncbi:hypothetical protein IKQ74_01240 [Candidatus Saccharibacteria bacterium]|nr:hypothetical protein [Candidatus Saccharibacteria bacterium]